MSQLKDFANKLNGLDYIGLSDEQLAAAITKNIIIVSGYADDVMELRGTIYENFYCLNGGIAYLDNNANVYPQKKPNAKAFIKAIWDVNGTWKWTYETNIPHETFEMFCEDKKYCKGIVFYKKDLKYINNEEI